MELVRAECLCKRYPKTSADAVHDVSFTVSDGQLVAVIGGNGAGKSTLIEMIVGQKRPTSGILEVLGLSPDDRGLSGKVGFLPQNASLFEKLTVRENLEYFQSLNDDDGGLDKLVELFDLAQMMDKRYEALSGGQKQRVCLACILTGHPRLVVLDEPATGFDPWMKEDVWKAFRKIKGTGAAVILTTHEVPEARKYSDRIIYMKNGKIVYDGVPSKLGSLGGYE